jgi:hypothetical protein
MAHFAKLGLNSKVIGVHVVDNERLLDSDGNEKEKLGIDYLVQVHGYPFWVQTSYNKNIRKNYAGTGFEYDDVRDAFIPPKPYPSWTLDEDTCLWDSPIPYPDDGNRYEWNESTKAWDAIA